MGENRSEDAYRAGSPRTEHRATAWYLRVRAVAARGDVRGAGRAPDTAAQARCNGRTHHVRSYHCKLVLSGVVGAARGGTRIMLLGTQ